MVQKHYQVDQLLVGHLNYFNTTDLGFLWGALQIISNSSKLIFVSSFGWLAVMNRSPLLVNAFTKKKKNYFDCFLFFWPFNFLQTMFKNHGNNFVSCCAPWSYGSNGNSLFYVQEVLQTFRDRFTYQIIDPSHQLYSSSLYIYIWKQMT